MQGQQPYRIMGIDPGTNVLGYAITEVRGNELVVLDLGIVTMKHLDTHYNKLKQIFERLSKLIDLHQPTEVAIEAPFFGKNVQSMLKLGRAQGVAIAAAMTKGIPITEYSPKKIKQSVTGNGNASKEQVAAMLQQLFKVKLDDYLLDATDALGTAVCHYFQAGLPSKRTAKTRKHKDWKSFLQDNPDRLR
ncbi:MAG: crossover junction endodeoxyribonuclease RuvC [Phaeodactylibacter sp.]|nr:crossover junction endodeoxyribonuclease RuvC [Phaeodactylibacter sp.]